METAQTMPPPQPEQTRSRKTAKEVLAFTNEQLAQGHEKLDTKLAAKLFIERGAAHVISGDLAAAKKDFLAAAECDPDFSEAYNNIAGICIRDGAFEEALEYACKAVTINAETPENNLMIAYEGKRITDKIGKKPNAVLYFKRGLLFETQKAYEKARDDFMKAVEFDPEFNEAWCKLGDTYLKLGEPEKAEEMYDEVADRVYDYDFHEDRLTQTKYWNHLVRKIACKPTANDCANVGSLYKRQETLPTFKKAREYFKKALEIDPHHGVALENLSTVDSVLHHKGHIDITEEVAAASQQVPDVIGKNKNSANTTLRKAGYKPRVSYRKTNDASQHGKVIETDPAAGTALEKGNLVDVVVGHPGLSLESLEGIGPKYREKLKKAKISTLNQLAVNPTIGDKISGISAKRTTLWANMANWILPYSEVLDGNAVELLVAGVGVNSPEEGYEEFSGQSARKIKSTLKAAAGKVKLPKGYLDENIDRLVDLLSNLS